MRSPDLMTVLPTGQQHEQYSYAGPHERDHRTNSMAGLHLWSQGTSELSMIGEDGSVFGFADTS